VSGMERLGAVLDDAAAPRHDGPAGAVKLQERIAELARRHPDNIHLNTFDLAHYLAMSEDEQEMFCWCLATDLTDLNNRAEASGGDEKTELPLAALGALVIALVIVGYFGKPAVMPVLFGAVALSILSAFVFVKDGRSAQPEELQEERDGMALPIVALGAMARHYLSQAAQRAHGSAKGD
jgi:hypothetical protein